MRVGDCVAAVVGAGPAGLFAVGSLLDAGVASILWVDASHDGSGRLKKYLAVPSNTKVRLFVGAVLACDSFKAAWEHVRANGGGKSLSDLETLAQDGECPLGFAAAALEELAGGILAVFKDRLTTLTGYCDRIERSTSADGTWTLSVGSEKFRAKMVVLATGSAPILPADHAAPHSKHGAAVIELDDALSPAVLSGLLGSQAGARDIAVVGCSHSAVLVLRNVSDILSARGDGNASRIKNFYRSPLKYAEYIDATTIINDNTGLKGLAANWARTHLEDGCAAPLSHMHRIKTDPSNESGIYDSELASCSSIIYAIGYARNSLPVIAVDGAEAKSVEHGEGGQLVVDGVPQPSLMGFGIAFPERIIGIAGNEESNVGLWKFIRFIRASISKAVPSIIA